MRTIFPAIEEKRYARYKRRYANEYFFDSRRRIDDPNASIGYATLESAKKKAKDAIDTYGASTVRIFDRKTGQYFRTYKKTPNGLRWSAGCEK